MEGGREHRGRKGRKRRKRTKGGQLEGKLKEKMDEWGGVRIEGENMGWWGREIHIYIPYKTGLDPRT